MPNQRPLHIAAFALSIGLGAISAAAAGPGSIVTPAPLLDEGPLGLQMTAAAPEIRVPAETRLETLLKSNRLQRTRIKGGDSTPTPAETAELAANPAFASAFRKNPEETLRLLAWINYVIASAHR